MTKEPLTVTLYSPHTGQRKLHESKKRFRVMACGRRWGKTLAVSNEMARHCLETPDAEAMWVAPTYRQTQIAFRLMAKALLPVISGDPNKSDLRIELTNGSSITFASAERYDNLRGLGLTFLVMDEVAQIDERAWTESLRPTLSDTFGRAIFIGTPRGRNWFWGIFQMGLKDSPTYDDEWESFTFPTSNNPYIPAKEIASAKKTTPEDTFRQEYEAEFLVESAGVFRNIEACVDEGGMRDYDQTCTYLLGWDAAKHEDFSVLTIFNVSMRRVDYWERFNRIDYIYQIDMVERLANRYHASVIMDATGVGDPLEELLRQKGLVVDFLKFNNLLKEQFIRHLALQFEQANFRMPRLPIVLEELRCYEYHYTPTGTIQYSAPPGKHDDCITSLGLVLWKARDYGDISFLLGAIPDAGLAMPVAEYEDEQTMMRQKVTAGVFDFLKARDFSLFSNGWLSREGQK